MGNGTRPVDALEAGGRKIDIDPLTGSASGALGMGNRGMEAAASAQAARLEGIRDFFDKNGNPYTSPLSQLPRASARDFSLWGDLPPFHASETQSQGLNFIEYRRISSSEQETGRFILDLAAQGYYANQIEPFHTLKDLARYIGFWRLNERGTWEPLPSFDDLNHGDLLMRGNPKNVWRNIFDPQQITVYRYENLEGLPPRFISFNRSYNRNESRIITPEAYLARKLGWSSDYIHQKYRKFFQEMREEQWSNPELKRLMVGLTKGGQTVAIEYALREILFYQRLTKTRGWLPSRSKGFLLRFVEQRRGRVFFVENFEERVDSATRELEKHGFLPEQSDALLLELAKYDETLDSWRSLPKIFEGIKNAIRWSPEFIAARPFRELSIQTLWQRFAGLSPEKLSSILREIAKREGHLTVIAYDHLISALQATWVVTVADKVERIQTLLEKTDLPVKSMEDWIDLSDSQRAEFLAVIELGYGAMRNFPFIRRLIAQQSETLLISISHQNAAEKNSIENWVNPRVEDAEDWGF